LVITAVIPSTHPHKNPTLAALARGARSIRITAMIGTGEIATPSAVGSRSPMTPPVQHSSLHSYVAREPTCIVARAALPTPGDAAVIADLR